MVLHIGLLARLDELVALEHGWYDGTLGVAISRDFADWYIENVERNIPGSFQFHPVPLIEGGLHEECLRGVTSTQAFG